MFSYAEYFAREHTGSGETFLRVTHWRPNESGELECSFDSHPGPSHKPTLVIVPACQLAPPERGIAPTCLAWVRNRHAEGAIVAAHWMFADELRRRFPRVDVDHDRLVIDSETATSGR